MARPLRIEFENALYHITSRGIERRTIFQDQNDRIKFLYYLRENIERYKVRLYAYMLMDNHYHIIVETPIPHLNKFMHDLNTAYSVYFNRRLMRVGPLFQGRYKAIIVDRGSYLLEVSRYVHLNPVRSGQVAKPADYPWSSYRAYLGINKVDWVSTEWLEERFGRHWREEYQKFMMDRMRVMNPFEKISAGLILGPASFVKKIKAQLKDREWTSEVPSLKRLKSPTVDDIIIRACEYFKVDKEEILSRRRGFLPRKIALYLVRKYTPIGVEEIGRIFNLSYSAVSKAIARMQVQEAKMRRAIRQIMASV